MREERVDSITRYEWRASTVRCRGEKSPLYEPIYGLRLRWSRSKKREDDTLDKNQIHRLLVDRLCMVFPENEIQTSHKITILFSLKVAKPEFQTYFCLEPVVEGFSVRGPNNGRMAKSHN